MSIAKTDKVPMDFAGIWSPTLEDLFVDGARDLRYITVKYQLSPALDRVWALLYHVAKGLDMDTNRISRAEIEGYKSARGS